MSTTKEIKSYQDALAESTRQIMQTALWAQEQADAQMRSYLDVRKSYREEAVKLAKGMTEQFIANQEAFQKLMHSTISLSIASMRFPTING